METHKCENCRRPATRIIEQNWVEYKLNDEGGCGTIIGGIDGTSQYYCDEHSN